MCLAKALFWWAPQGGDYATTEAGVLAPVDDSFTEMMHRGTRCN
ncbi:hypothetical protein ACVJGD_008904 [Bradyrhizobium sp. USDA 10063]